MWNSNSTWLTLSDAALQYSLCACSVSSISSEESVLIIFSPCTFSEMMSSLLALMTGRLVWSLSASIPSRGRLSSCEVSSWPVACRRYSESVAWCSTFARWGTSESNLHSQRRQLASLLLLSASIRNHFKESWFLRMINLVPYKYGRCGTSAQRIARRSRCVMSRLRLASVRDWN